MIKQWQDKFNSADSYISMALGLAVVLVIGTLAYNFASQRPQPQTPENKQTEQKQEQKTHVVQEGDTLWGIAETYYQDGFKWKQIAQANNLTNGVTTGQSLIIPDETNEGEISAASTDIPTGDNSPTPTKSELVLAPTATPTTIEKPGATGPTGATPIETTTPEPTESSLKPTDLPSPTPVVQATEKTIKTYTVVHGDTLWDIAVKQYNDGYKWSDIARANNLVNPNIIHSGNILTLP